MPDATPSIQEPMRVLFIAAEADPLIKVGGLGDVAGSLPPALRALTPEQTGYASLDVRLVLPFHSGLRKKIHNPRLEFSFFVPHVDGPIPATVISAQVNGGIAYLISGMPFGLDAPVYSIDPRVDGMKYGFFSLAALELARQLNWQPHIIHANDWHTALSLYALRLTREQDVFFANTRSVISVHNLPFMGAGSETALAAYGLPASPDIRLPIWARQVPLPLGMLSADRVVAVSPTYASEILTPEFGCGLQDFLTTRHSNLTGIVNGLDQTAWNPATDTALPQRFTAQTLADRQQNKLSLLREFYLDPDPEAALIIVISRLDQQKGIDLALDALRQVADIPWQAIILGTGDTGLEAACIQLESAYPERVRAITRFDLGLARRMYAGGDMILMPSRYEPCGLAQMIAMRYGCIPVARATGGLKDTITDADDRTNSTGFLFREPSASALSAAILRALAQYKDPMAWQAMQLRGMASDFSWERSAIAYTEIYKSLLS